jgi:hypothetical protein
VDYLAARANAQQRAAGNAFLRVFEELPDGTV